MYSLPRNEIHKSLISTERRFCYPKLSDCRPGREEDCLRRDQSGSTGIKPVTGNGLCGRRDIGDALARHWKIGWCYPRNVAAPKLGIISGWSASSDKFSDLFKSLSCPTCFHFPISAISFFTCC